jgi:elongation factor Ts
MVKELREKTGAGMMDCKKALAEAAGDMEQAIDELRKRGQAIATKAGARAAKEGLIFSRIEPGVGTLLELNCVTDFVARNEDFQALGNELLGIVHGGGAADPAALLDAAHPSGKPVREVLTEAIAKTGENIVVSRFDRLQAGANGTITGYIHFTAKNGVLVELSAGSGGTFAKPEVQQLAVDLAQHIAFSAPVALDRDSAPADLIERERAIYADQVKLEGKPEKIWDKIVEGKMAKYFKDVCLLDQAFVKDNDQTIRGLIEAVGKQAGDTIVLKRYLRYEIGGGDSSGDESAS